MFPGSFFCTSCSLNNQVAFKFKIGGSLFFDLATPAAPPMWSIRLEGGKRLVDLVNQLTLERCHSQNIYGRLHYRPSKHGTLIQCCSNVVPPSTTLGQHWSNIGSMGRVCWGRHSLCCAGNATHGSNVDLMLVHRRRR